MIEDVVRREFRELRDTLRRERDDAVSALRHSLEDRLLLVETGILGVEERVESRIQTLDESLQRTLAAVIPDTLLMRDEEQATAGQPSTSSSTSTPAGVSSSAARSAAATCASRPLAGTALWAPAPAGAAGDEEGERRRLQQRIEEVKRRKERAQAVPFSMGEDLCEAAFKGSLEDVRRLLNSGTEVNYTDTWGRSPLISTFVHDLNFETPCNPSVVSLLLERGADVRAVDVFGLTALHCAAVYDTRGRCVELLLGAGADVDARDTYGATPLHRAAWNKNEAAVRALLAAGARRNIRGWVREFMNKTPFDVAGTSAIRNLLRP